MEIYVIQRSSPLDDFEKGTVSVAEWLAEDPKETDLEERRDQIEREARRVNEFVNACAAVHFHPRYDALLRQAPRVTHCLFEDTPLFIFKIDNNGDTFIVGPSAERYRDNKDKFSDDVVVTFGKSREQRSKVSAERI